MKDRSRQAGAEFPARSLIQDALFQTGSGGGEQSGIEPTPAMIEAGVAFLRDALGDLYPAQLLDERELVAELFTVMAKAREAACS